MEAFLLDSHARHNLAVALQDICGQHLRPSTIHKPRVFPDGDAWCALYGDSIQEGVAGFGKSPELAMLDFDDNWHKEMK